MRYAVKTAHFFILRGKYVLLRQVGNALVAAHVRATSTSATPDTANEMLQEQLRKAVRKIEFRCHTLKEAYTELGKELLHDEETTQERQQEEGTPTGRA